MHNINLATSNLSGQPGKGSNTWVCCKCVCVCVYVCGMKWRTSF